MGAGAEKGAGAGKFRRGIVKYLTHLSFFILVIDF